MNAYQEIALNRVAIKLTMKFKTVENEFGEKFYKTFALLIVLYCTRSMDK